MSCNSYLTKNETATNERSLVGAWVTPCVSEDPSENPLPIADALDFPSKDPCQFLNKQRLVDGRCICR